MHTQIQAKSHTHTHTRWSVSLCLCSPDTHTHTHTHTRMQRVVCAEGPVRWQHCWPDMLSSSSKYSHHPLHPLDRIYIQQESVSHSEMFTFIVSAPVISLSLFKQQQQKKYWGVDSVVQIQHSRMKTKRESSYFPSVDMLWMVLLGWRVGLTPELKELL